MSPSDFGSRYLSIRDQLASLMAGVASLADEVGVDVAGELPLDELRGGLRRPFVFGVCGEVNAGKSTFLNALFGSGVCRVNVVPETLWVTHYRHGERVRDVRKGDGGVECERTVEFLEDFHLIDTPGTNAADAGQRGLMVDALLRAEVIFCVLSVENPWAAATWNFLTELPKEVLERVVLVLQQVDKREAKDLPVIRGHLRDLSMKRLGWLPRVFAVSGLEAFDAKRREPVDLAGWRASGFAELEDYLARVVCQAPGRWAILAEWRDGTARALRVIEDRMEDCVRGMREHGHFLEDVEGEIDVAREHFVKRLPHHLADVADVFEVEAHVVTRVLWGKLGVVRSVWRLFGRRKVGVVIEQLFIERLKVAVEEVADADADEVVGFCRGHWKGLGPRVDEALGIQLGGDAGMEQAMRQARMAFVKRLGRAASEGVDKLSVRRQLDVDLRMRNVSLTSFTAATLLLTTVGACFGALGFLWLPWIFCGLAGVFLIGGAAVAMATRRAITREHERALADACGRFAKTLRDDYEEALMLIFRDYGQCLAVVREHLVRESHALEPRRRRWQEMFLHLKAVEQEI